MVAGAAEKPVPPVAAVTVDGSVQTMAGPADWLYRAWKACAVWRDTIRQWPFRGRNQNEEFTAGGFTYVGGEERGNGYHAFSAEPSASHHSDQASRHSIINGGLRLEVNATNMRLIGAMRRQEQRRAQLEVWHKGSHLGHISGSC
ncbi:MAG: hypothetical protein QOJ50_2 [Cryptosporangiaceae bacterium]|nr:hypothetical protein [Cryptosporangiaceae bacterium]